MLTGSKLANRLVSPLLCAAVGSFCWISLAGPATAQQQPNAAPGSQPNTRTNDPHEVQNDRTKLVTMVYRLTDLVTPAPNYPFEGIDIPGLFGRGDRRAAGASGGGMGMGGLGAGTGMGGMPGGGGGGGFMSQPDNVSLQPSQPMWLGQLAGGAGGSAGDALGMLGVAEGGQPASFRFTISDVAQMLESAIDPQSWQQQGGSGNIVVLGGNLVVTQTAENHRAIQELLSAIRDESGALRTITIRAHWITMTAEELHSLRPDPENVYDRGILAEFAAKQKGYSGQISCFDGQTVHIIAGKMQTVIQSVIPVVGQNEVETERELAAEGGESPFRLAQFGAGTGGGLGGVAGPPFPRGSAVGYQPSTATVFAGALLEVTPMYVAEDKSVVLDLRSVVSRPSAAGDSVSFTSENLPIDRLSVAAHRIMTTVRVSLDNPTIVGGLTVQPDANAESGEVTGAAETPQQQLYLFVEASLEQKTPASAAK